MVSPRLLDSFGRLDLMLRKLNEFDLELANDLDLRTSTVEHDKRLFKEKKHHDNLIGSIQELSISLETYHSNLAELKDYIQKRLRHNEVKLIQEDYKNYESFSATIEERIALRKSFSENLNAYIFGLKNSTSNWQYAGVDLYPTDPKFTREIVSSDPTYIIADNQLQDIVSKEFNDFFASRRLRKYGAIQDLPDASIGVAYCFGKYECMPIDPIKDEASILFDKMLPGGVFYFTYNNCEYRPSLEFCNGFRAYQTESIITSMMYGIGFDKLDNKVFDDGVWNVMIVKKPGELKSQKQATPSIEIVPLGLTSEQETFINQYRASDPILWYNRIQVHLNEYPGVSDKSKIMTHIQGELGLLNIDSESK